MHTNISDRLRKIVNEIDEQGHANQTKLAVLKKWFERPQRLCAFATWVARRAISGKHSARGVEAELFREARKLFTGVDPVHPELDRQAANALHSRLRDFQNEHRRLQWGPVRLIRSWDLLLVEQALAIHLWHRNSPPLGYTLAADYCRHYDFRYGTDLNGPSRAKVEGIVKFVIAIETSEEDPE